MSYAVHRRHIIGTLTTMFAAYTNIDFSDRQLMGEVHSVASDMLYRFRTNQLIHDYSIHVRFKSPFDEMRGYEIDIKIWPQPNTTTVDNFILFILPTDTDVCDDPIAAYDRAMKVL